MENNNRFYPAWLEFLPWLFLVLFWVYTATQYSGLPDTYPYHFGAGGTPNAWAETSPFIVFLMPAVATIMTGMFTFFNTKLLPNTNEPMKYINLPNKPKGPLPQKTTEKIRGLIIRSLYALNITLSLAFFSCGYYSIQTALGQQASISWSYSAFIVLIVFVVFIALYMSFRLTFIARSSMIK